MTGPTGADAELSVRRSRRRLQTLITLSSLGEAYASQLADAVGASAFTVRCVLHGYPPRYREELSLVALGLARCVETPNGRMYEITTKGRRKARSITSRWTRHVTRGA